MSATFYKGQRVRVKPSCEAGASVYYRLDADEVYTVRAFSKDTADSLYLEGKTHPSGSFIGYDAARFEPAKRQKSPSPTPRKAGVGDVIRITRKDFEGGGNWLAGKVYTVDSVEGTHFVRVIPKSGSSGLLNHSEYEVLNEARVGEYVTPNHDDWYGWPRGAYEVLAVDVSGYSVKNANGRSGVFLYSLSEKCDAPVVTPPDFSVEEAQRGFKMKFRSGCDVVFVAYVPSAKPHCQLVLLNPSTGNVVTRYANGKASTETVPEPGDILIVRD